ncbi:MAG TPA: hypothetical protein VFZ61_08690 [Polyangiales bacterium]
MYASLAARWRGIAREVRDTAAQVEAQRELPMGEHDDGAWGPEQLQAFETFVRAQGQALALLRVAQERDQRMLRSMESG